MDAKRSAQQSSSQEALFAQHLPQGLLPDSSAFHAADLQDNATDPAWRADAAACGFSSMDLSAHVGSQIIGIALDQCLDPETARLLRDACAERRLLLFRRQHRLSEADLLMFADGLGKTPHQHCVADVRVHTDCEPPKPQPDSGRTTP